jgi:hypothetical protein
MPPFKENSSDTKSPETLLDALNLEQIQTGSLILPKTYAKLYGYALHLGIQKTKLDEFLQSKNIRTTSTQAQEKVPEKINYNPPRVMRPQAYSVDGKRRAAGDVDDFPPEIKLSGENKWQVVGDK